MSDKELVLEAIRDLPEDASIDLISDRVGFIAGIRKGLKELDAGEVVSHEEAKRQLAEWLTA